MKSQLHKTRSLIAIIVLFGGWNIVRRIGQSLPLTNRAQENSAIVNAYLSHALWWIFVALLIYLTIAILLVITASLVPRISIINRWSTKVPMALKILLLTGAISLPTTPAFADSFTQGPMLVPVGHEPTTSTTTYTVQTGKTYESSTTTSTTPLTSTSVQTAVTPKTQTPPLANADSYTVKTGDSFWSIAEAVLRTQSSEISQQQIAEYWVQLIDVNRKELKDPNNPDLIFPGQVFRLPQI